MWLSNVFTGNVIFGSHLFQTNNTFVVILAETPCEELILKSFATTLRCER